MCDSCGCGDDGDKILIRKPGDEIDDSHQHTYKHKHSHEHDDDLHHHDHHHHYTHTHERGHNKHKHDHVLTHKDHNHDHDHEHIKRTEIKIEQDILGQNSLLAERNRGYFEAKNILALNLVSSPGSGKTSLLEKTITDLKNDVDFYVIEGDQHTMNDANRIHKTGAPVIQVNTGNGCHLDSDMVHTAFKELDVANDSILMIENVGNLVCPSLFDLGESKRVIIISVTEGDDKPIKYPTMFGSSDICIINKIDLLPYVDFDVEQAKKYASQVNHHIEFIELSVKTGEGMDIWYDWLKEEMKG